MVPFWESIFERSTADMERNVIPAAHFAKINGNFLNKKPGEVRHRLIWHETYERLVSSSSNSSKPRAMSSSALYTT